MDKFHYEEVEVGNYMQPQLKYPCKLNPQHKSFVLDYKTKGFLYVAKKYGDWGVRWKLKVFFTHIKSLLKPLVDRLR